MSREWEKERGGKNETGRAAASGFESLPFQVQLELLPLCEVEAEEPLLEGLLLPLPLPLLLLESLQPTIAAMKQATKTNARIFFTVKPSFRRK